MLEIVAKRAALRPSDAGQAQGCSSADGLDTDVSYHQLGVVALAPNSHLNNWTFILFQLGIIYACILYYAFTRDND